jgi:cytochrome c biogenesis protein CcdA
MLATTASLIRGVAAFSNVIYALLAVGFLSFGLHALIVRDSCSHKANPRPSSSVTTLCGSAFGLVLSPCCTPVIAMVASAGIYSSSVATALAGALAFAAGHVAPLATIGFGLGAAERFAPLRALSAAATTISGGLSLALAGYYGLLA